jgi:hypothetical protein
MKAFIRTAATVIAVGLAVTACSADKKNEDILAQDSSLTRDLALANQDTLSQPQLQDVPANAVQSPVESTPAPAPKMRVVARGSGREVPPLVTRRTQSAPAPEATPQPVVTESGNAVTEGTRGSERQLGMINAGENISMYAGQKVCTNTNSVGDRFTATLVESVQGTNGASIPAGATAIVEITRASRSNNSSDPVELELAVRSISINGRSYQVASTVTSAQVDRVRAETGSDDARKVATGAAIGAIAGQILGRRTKSTVIGAATGAAAGAIVAARNAHYDGCIPTGGRIAIRLTEPLYVQL